MERKTARHKLLRRKYKHYAAAVAGAAILSGAALPGIPTAKVLAAENPPPSPPAKIAQLKVPKDAQKAPQQQPTPGKTSKKRRNKPGTHHDHKQAGYKVYHRNHNRDYDRDYYVYRGDGVTVRYLGSPVDVIKENASVYGFDPDRDTFTFLSLSAREASVQVTKHTTGERFRVELARSYNRDWRIVGVYKMIY